MLPVGSVVLLEGGEKRVMIFGVMQTDTIDENTAIDYDYIGVLYPEGNMGQEFQFLFNHEDIKEVFFRGFEDDEREHFLQNMGEIFASGLLEAQGGLSPAPPTDTGE